MFWLMLPLCVRPSVFLHICWLLTLSRDCLLLLLLELNVVLRVIHVCVCECVCVYLFPRLLLLDPYLTQGASDWRNRGVLCHQLRHISLFGCFFPSSFISGLLPISVTPRLECPNAPSSVNREKEKTVKGLISAQTIAPTTYVGIYIS